MTSSESPSVTGWLKSLFFSISTLLFSHSILDFYLQHLPHPFRFCLFPASFTSLNSMKEVMVLISWKRRKDSSTRAAGTMGKQGRLFHCLLPLFYNSPIICCCYSFPRFYYCQLVWGCDFWMSAFRLLYGFDLSVYSNIIFIWMHIILEGKEF